MEDLASTQNAFFVLANNYDFNPPLFLEVVGNYINDIKEELNEEGHGYIAEEAHDLGGLIEEFDDDLISHGVLEKDIGRFILASYHLKRAIKSKGKKKIEGILAELSELHQSFIKKYQ